MISKEMMSLRIPRDVRAWITEEAGKRRMNVSEYMLVLLTRGIQADTFGQAVARIEAATQPVPGPSDVPRDVLELRYLVELLVKQAGLDRVTLGTDSALYAERELAKRAKKGK